MKTVPPPYPIASATPAPAPVLAESRPAGVHYAAIGDAWDLVNAELPTWVLASVASAAVFTSVVLVQIYVAATSRTQAEAAWGDLTLSLRIVGTGLVIPLTAYALMTGMMHMAVKQSYGERIHLSDLFVGIRHMWRMAAVGLISIFAFYIGCAFCLLPGVFVAGSFCLAGLDSVERGGSPFSAINRTFKALSQNGWHMGLLVAASALVSCLGALLLGIGVVVTMPILAVVLGLHYTYLFPRPTGASQPLPKM